MHFAESLGTNLQNYPLKILRQQELLCLWLTVEVIQFQQYNKIIEILEQCNGTIGSDFSARVFEKKKSLNQSFWPKALVGMYSKSEIVIL